MSCHPVESSLAKLKLEIGTWGDLSSTNHAAQSAAEHVGVRVIINTPMLDNGDISVRFWAVLYSLYLYTRKCIPKECGLNLDTSEGHRGHWHVRAHGARAERRHVREQQRKGASNSPPSPSQQCGIFAIIKEKQKITETVYNVFLIII